MKGYSSEKKKIRNNLFSVYNIDPKFEDRVVLKSWDLSKYTSDSNQLFDEFDKLINNTVPQYETELKEELQKNEVFFEGTIKRATLNKYERNLQARKKCLEVHGTSCVLCGINFGEKYGSNFAGIIEVHHIVPISQIGKEYEVDPINDLVPVCPNCHTALHSRGKEVYTIEELKQIMKH